MNTDPLQLNTRLAREETRTAPKLVRRPRRRATSYRWTTSDRLNIEALAERLAQATGEQVHASQALRVAVCYALRHPAREVIQALWEDEKKRLIDEAG